MSVHPGLREPEASLFVAPYVEHVRKIENAIEQKEEFQKTLALLKQDAQEPNFSRIITVFREIQRAVENLKGGVVEKTERRLRLQGDLVASPDREAKGREILERLAGNRAVEGKKSKGIKRQF
jgi:hypothetical protein